MSILVLGIGSPFADDQAGWLVADKLKSVDQLQFKMKIGELVIESENRPGLNLLDWLQRGYQKIYLVDMVKTNLAETGNLYELQAKDIIGFSGMLSSHNLGVSPSLALAEVLGYDISNITFLGIEGELHGVSEEISSAMLAAVESVVDLLITKLI